MPDGCTAPSRIGGLLPQPRRRVPDDRARLRVLSVGLLRQAVPRSLQRDIRHGRDRAGPSGNRRSHSRPGEEAVLRPQLPGHQRPPGAAGPPAGRPGAGRGGKGHVHLRGFGSQRAFHAHRPPVPPGQGGMGAHQGGVPGAQLPRRHGRRPVDDRPLGCQPLLRPQPDGHHQSNRPDQLPGAVRRFGGRGPGRAGRGRGARRHRGGRPPHGGGVHGRADLRGGGHAGAARLLLGTHPRRLRPLRRPVHHRRDRYGGGADRRVPGHGSLRGNARHLQPGQGPRRRIRPAGRHPGQGLHRRRHRRAEPPHGRSPHLQRRPRLLRGGARGARCDREGGPGGAGRQTGRFSAPSAGRGAGRSGVGGGDSGDRPDADGRVRAAGGGQGETSRRGGRFDRPVERPV